MLMSLIIPCYNEEKNIPLILERLESVFKERPDIEIVLVDNGSEDNSALAFKQGLSQSKLAELKVVTLAKNNGYGNGILEGLRAARGELLAWTHADMQTDPQDVLKALELYQEKQPQDCFIKGKRKNRKWLEQFLTFGMQIVAFLSLRSYLDDINAQPKLFSRDFYERYVKDKAPLDFSLDLFVLYQAKQHFLPIYTLPVYFADRKHGEAKGGGGSWKNRLKLIKRTFTYIFKLRSEVKQQ